MKENLLDTWVFLRKAVYRFSGRCLAFKTWYENTFYLHFKLSSVPQKDFESTIVEISYIEDFKIAQIRPEPRRRKKYNNSFKTPSQ